MKRGTSQPSTTSRSGFTLVEILIVVVILGVLAAVVSVGYLGLVADARSNGTRYELEKIRRVIDVYMARNSSFVPTITTGDGTWGELITNNREYLKSPPSNVWVGGVNKYLIVAGPGVGPDTAFHRDYGWLFNTSTGELWAAAFDSNDDPLPQP